MAKVKVTQVKSTSGRQVGQKRTLYAMGLRYTNSSVEIELNPAMQGMIDKVNHLVKVENI